MSDERHIEKLFDMVNEMRVEMATSHTALNTKMDSVMPVIKQNTDDIASLTITAEQHKKYVSGIGWLAGGGMLAGLTAWINSIVKGH